MNYKNPAPYEHPPCERAECGGPVFRRDNEAADKWRQRKFCSARCRGRAQSLRMADQAWQTPHAPCVAEGCNQPVVRREGETVANYRRRQCCSIECAKAVTKAGHAAYFGTATSAGEWPEITGSELRGNCFGKYNIDPGDGGSLRVSRPATHVPAVAPLA